jgi:hypothetical protein
MKILISECVNHYKVIENTYKMIKLNCINSDITLFVNKDKSGKNLRELLFEDANSANWIIHNFHSSTYFIHFLFIAHKYDVINISTGPEDPHYNNFFNVIFFYISSIIYKNKIVLTVKNTRPYLKSTRGIKPFFLNLAISNIKVITFETNTLKYIFHKETGISLSRLCVSYDRYVDLYSSSRSEKEYSNLDNKKYRIGLLGAVEAHRRDYFEIINALKIVPITIRENMLFVTLGNTNGGTSNKILIELKKLVDVDITDGWISAEDFDKRGAMCDLLISPLKSSMEYGLYKGSGTFGDAVYLRKKVIVPSHVDPFYEFKEVALFYDNNESLSQIFINIDEAIKGRVSGSFYRKFYTCDVYKKIKKIMVKKGII